MARKAISKTKQFQVFISHSSIDTWVAEQIALHIADSGAKSFLDKNDIQHGDNFDDKIREGIFVSNEFLVLLTPWALLRPYIWYEAGLFLGDKKRKARVIGVVHGISKTDIATRAEIPAWIKEVDLVDINDLESYFVQLKRRVKNWSQDG